MALALGATDAVAGTGAGAGIGTGMKQAGPSADAGADAHAGRIRFDLPQSSLHEALQQYSAITGRSLLYDSKIMLGRVSAPLNGRYTPQQALRLLIAGTGLEARYTSAEAFMLVPIPTQEDGSRPPPDTLEQAAQLDPMAAQTAAQADAVAARERYFGLMQARMMEALCADPTTAPGKYRLALRFRIDAANSVRQLEIHATGRFGHSGLAARVRARLNGLDLRAAPPPQLQQPVTLLILPDDGAAC